MQKGLGLDPTSKAGQIMDIPKTVKERKKDEHGRTIE